MIIPVVGLLVLLLPGVLGGRLSRLAMVRLRAVGPLACSLLAQIVIVEVVTTGPRSVLTVVHVATYAGAAWFLWANRRVPGLVVVAAGALSNGVAIAVNGGVLPATSSALAVAGLTDPDGFTNSGVVDDPRLWFLGDVFAIPAGWPLANVFSVGDLLILLGAGFASIRISGTCWSSPWTAPRRHAPPRHRRHPGEEALARGPGAGTRSRSSSEVFSTQP
jgi:hypothetical protein